MLQRLLEIKEPLSAVLASQKTGPESLSSTDWEIAHELVKVLKTF